MKVCDYRELDVWTKGMSIVDNIYTLTDQFPPIERFGLFAHMRKTSISIPSNIAEGFMRHHTKEFQQFLYVSLGSCAELFTQGQIAQRRKYMTSDTGIVLEELLDHECRMLRRLIQSLKRRIDESRTTQHEPR